MSGSASPWGNERLFPLAFARLLDVELLLIGALVVLVGTASALALTIGHGVFRVWYDRGRAEHLDALRDILAGAVLGLVSPHQAAERLAAATRRDLIRLFVAHGRVLGGSSGFRLHETASALGLVAWAEARCSARSWPLRLQAVRLLQVIGGGDRMVPGLVMDPVPEVRRAAARWIARRGKADGVVRLLGAADAPGVLDEVTLLDTLHQAGRRHVGPLVRYLLDPGPGLVPVLRAVQGVADPRLLPPTAPLARHPSSHVRREAARVLGAIGTPEAAGLLRGLLADADPTVRRRAVDGLAHIRDWRSAADVAHRLVDADVQVRRSAAMALRGFGSPGIVLLRRAIHTGDEGVRRTAQHVLDLPDTVDFGGIA